eukprot:540363-Ditylum_brightwellii.AAC.1
MERQNHNWCLAKKNDVWKARNAYLHGPSDAELPSHLNKRVKHAYANPRHAMFKHDQLLFQKPLQDWLAMSASSKLAWLEA